MARKIDHTQAREKGKRPKVKPTQKEWWLADANDLAASIAGVVRTIRERSARLEAQRMLSARLYGNLSVMGIQGVSVSKATAMLPALRDRITYNVVESAIDTVTARIAKNKPKPLFLTDGGDFNAQRRAKKLTKFVEGMFYENKIRQLSPRTFRESAIFGDGFVRVFERDGRVRMSRSMCSGWFIDDVEGFDGNPRQAHNLQNIDKAVLIQVFKKFLEDKVEGVNPKAVEILEKSQAAAPDSYSGVDSSPISDQVAVMESWHLPSGPEADDGISVISLAEEWLYRGKWEHDFFPVARLPWRPAVYGYWSRGLAESIQNIQLEMNKLLWLIQRSMHLMGTFKIALEYGSKVVKSHITNDVGAIIWYNKTQPMYLTPQVVPAEYYAHFERLKAAAYDQAGVSELSATSEKPAGLDSGKALRTYDDIQTDRFQTVGQQYEEFHMELARLAIATAKDIHERAGKFEVSVPGRKFLETISWGEIDLDDDDYVMQVYPISHLPQDPAGRLQTVQEEMQAGLYDMQTGKMLLDYPDLDQADSLQDALLDRIHLMLGDIVDKGKYEPPDGYMIDPAGTARRLAMQYYNRGASQGLSESRLDQLRTWMQDIDMLVSKSLPPPPLGQPGADAALGGPPQAVPEAPPQSPMLPNAPPAAA